MITILTGCSANYEIDYSNNRYNENLTTSGNITDTNYKNEIDNYYSKSYLLTSYKVQPGDILIITAYAYMDLEEAKTFKPKIVHPDTLTNLLK